ncbi:hypothetical protein ACOMHN_061500 [Nucella lapillus]
MEKKCPHHATPLLCRHRPKDAVGEPGTSSGGPTKEGKVGPLKLVVVPTTGGRLTVCVSPAETVRGLKIVLARKYRIAPARINLLHKDRVGCLFKLCQALSACFICMLCSGTDFMVFWH